MSIEGEEPIPTDGVEATAAGDGEATAAAGEASAMAEAADPGLTDPADATETVSLDDAPDDLVAAAAEGGPEPVPSIRASRSLAAFLSFLIPGTGQILSGRIAVGAFFLLPVLVVAVVGLVLAAGDPATALGIVLEPGVLLGIVVADVVLFAWRATAIIDAWWNVGANVPRSPLSVVVLAILLAVTGATHVVVGAEVLAVHDTVDAIFASSGDENGFGELPAGTDAPSTSPVGSPSQRATGEATPRSIPTVPPTPSPTPEPVPDPLVDGRLDVLLIGADAGPGRWSLRTDTMIVLSVDVASGKAALFSIPRNMVNVPLPKETQGAFGCKCYPALLNSLYVYASAHPGQFPGNDSVRGLRAVQLAIGTLIGRKLDGMVLVKLQGFVKLVNAIGGIDINVPRAIYDSHYPLENGTGDVVVNIRAGKQHMNGHKALMYARSRHQDSDYGRMDRQQTVLAAVAKKLLKGDLLAKLPKMLKIAKENLWTNLKTSDLPELAKLAKGADIKNITRVRFVPPRYREYLDRASINAIRSVVKHVFDKAKPHATPRPTGTPTPTPPIPLG